MTCVTQKTTRTSRTSRTWKCFNTAWSHPIAATVRCGIGVGRQLQSVSYVRDKTSKVSVTCEINWADCQFTCEMCEMCGMFLFSALYIDLRQKNPDEIVDFCEEEGGGRMRRADVGLEIRQKKKRDLRRGVEQWVILVERLLIFMERLLIFVERPLIFVEQLLISVEQLLILWVDFSRPND